MSAPEAVADPAPRSKVRDAPWVAAPPPWGWRDLVPIAAWVAGLLAFFWDAATLRRALFYFDITEINYPYRDFLAGEIRSGRFARWMPGLGNGLPLFAESQAGYLHPLKVLYAFLPTWQALNLDTIGSIGLTGLATYAWLRRHLGRSGAATGAAVFGLSGFVWAHLIHTSMTNALVSVPLVFWAAEVSWDGGRLRGAALGALALACQVFAGHLQDTILTVGALGVYTLYRALTARSWATRAGVVATAGVLVGLGVALAAVQWVPSKNLLDRSPRVGGLTWDQLTYGSWSPELLPTLVVREAYGTRARDTDWLDGYYPYHEMNAYLGLIALTLALVGAGAGRDRWVGFWVILAGAGALLMLGRYTALFDRMNRVPVIGSSRIPVRYHLWVSLAVAVLAGVGVDRLARPGRVRLRWPLVAAGGVVLAGLAIALTRYAPAWNDARWWRTPGSREHFAWLSAELAWACGRTAALATLAWGAAALAVRASRPGHRAAWAAALPALVLLDLLGSHLGDVPTIDPGYWLDPPESVRRLRGDPTLVRVYGVAERSAAEPGYLSRPVDFFAIRDSLGWSLPPVWGLRSPQSLTPLYARRSLTFGDHARPPLARFEVEGTTHVLTGNALPNFPGPTERAGTAVIHHVPTALPRARLMGRPRYVADEAAAGAALEALGAAIRDRPIVEDPDRPVAEGAEARGSARIGRDEPEAVEVAVENLGDGPAYLVLADTFDPGWSATVDGAPAAIRPAYAAFRAVAVPPGRHEVAFRYEPAGFRLGLVGSGLGLVGLLVCLLWPRAAVAPDRPDAPDFLPRWLIPALGAGAIALLVASTVRVDAAGRWGVQSRWEGAFHGFTWAADIEAIQPMRKALGR